MIYRVTKQRIQTMKDKEFTNYRDYSSSDWILFLLKEWCSEMMQRRVVFSRMVLNPVTLEYLLYEDDEDTDTEVCLLI